MSSNWIENRLVDAVNDPVLANDIISNGYTRVISIILPDGTIAYKKLNSNSISDWTDWTP